MTELGIPLSNATVRVRMIDTTSVMVVNAIQFIEPVQKGHELLNIYDAAFLLDHAPSGRKIMFDLGARKDYWNLPAGPQKRLGLVTPALRVDMDTTEILQEKGIALSDISSIVWSHYHWDHTGSTELFPPSTELVVGSGFKESSLLMPGFPINPNSPVDTRELQGRKVTEVEFEGTGLLIGGFRAFDFFGDGSLYLLDSPGHCVGHMCGLARTTGGSDSTFVLLGGDISHFPGNFRPGPLNVLPQIIPREVLIQSDHEDCEIRNGRDQCFPTPCPCSIFTDRHPLMGEEKQTDFDPRSSPFYRISTTPTSAYANPSVSQRSLEKLMAFDACPSVLVCLSHDEAIIRYLPSLNRCPEDDLNNWKLRNFKERICWCWLNDLPRQGKPGRREAVHGFWRDGNIWDEAKEILCKNGGNASSGGL